MTAPEPTRPADEHTDAVARAMRQDPKSGGRNMSDVAREVYAERLLTLTDPAVHAAMLAALVRAGVLTEELGVLALRPDGERWLAARFRTRGAAEAYCHLGAGLAVAHRHVTPWEVAP